MRNAFFFLFILGFSFSPPSAYAFISPSPAATGIVQPEPSRFQQWKGRLIQKAVEKKAAKAVSGEAIGSFGAALLLILAFALSFGLMLPIFALAACVLGILALRKIKKKPEMGGKLLAFLGLFIGGLGIIMTILFVIGFSGQG